MIKTSKVRVIRYPIMDLIGTYSFVLFTLLVIAYLSPSTRSGFVISTFIWTIFYYFTEQYRYISLSIYRDRIQQVFPASFYLRNRTYMFSNINFVFFQFHTGSWVNPYLKIYFKDGKRRRISMPKHELEQIKYELKEAGLVMKNARFIYDRP